MKKVSKVIGEERRWQDNITMRAWCYARRVLRTAVGYRLTVGRVGEVVGQGGGRGEPGLPTQGRMGCVVVGDCRK